MGCGASTGKVAPTEMIKTLSGHSEAGHSEGCWVSKLAIAPDGRTLYSVSGNKTIKVCGLPSGECLQTLSGHSDRVRTLALAPDGRTLYSGSYDKTIKVWGLPSGECLQTLAGHSDMVSTLALAPDGRTLYSGSQDKTIKVWGLPGGECLQTLSGHSYAVRTLALAPDGRTLYSGSQDQTIKVWGLPSGECLQTLSGHYGSVLTLALAPDGRTLYSGSGDKTIKVWGLPSGECLQTLSGHPYAVHSLTLAPDGRTLYSGSDDTTIKVWGLPSGECLQTLAGHYHAVASLALAPDGRTLYSGSLGTIQVWMSHALKQQRNQLVELGLDASQASSTITAFLENDGTVFNPSELSEAGAKKARDTLRNNIKSANEAVAEGILSGKMYNEKIHKFVAGFLYTLSGIEIEASEAYLKTCDEHLATTLAEWHRRRADEVKTRLLAVKKHYDSGILTEDEMRDKVVAVALRVDLEVFQLVHGETPFDDETMTMLSSKQGDKFAAYQQLQTTASSADATTAAATASPEEPASQLAAPLQSDASLVTVEAPDLNSSPRDVPHGAPNAISANGAVGDPVMISYRVPETGATELGGDGTVVRLADSLRAMGIGCFVGESALQPGQKWALNIQEAVKECKVFVVLCSPSYGDTPWTYREIQLADNNKKPLLAVWHSGTYPPPKVEIWLGGEQRLPRGHHPMTHPSVRFDDIVVELLSALERFGVKPTL